MRHEDFMREAIALAGESVRKGGGPFGAVIVRGGEIIARGTNSVTLLNDPTAHAEVTAIRRACADGETFSLAECDLYTSCEPCPMCLSAAYWAGVRTIYYGANRHDAAEAGFDDSFIYDQIALPGTERAITCINIAHGEALAPFRQWAAKPDKMEY